MRIILEKNLELISGGVMQHPDCDEWFFEATASIADGELGDAYSYIVKMEEGGCVNPLQED